MPQVFFAFGAGTLPLTTLSLILLLAPKLQFLLDRPLSHAALTRAQFFAFLAVWVGLAVYSDEARRASRQPLTDCV